MPAILAIASFDLATVVGGVAPPADQTKLRQLASQYCPATYAKNASQRTLTRGMAETCLDEAHMGWAKGQLDQYFPPKR